MVYQIRTSTVVLGRIIKVPQTFIQRIIRVIILADNGEGGTMENVIHVVNPVSPVTYLDCQAVATAVGAWCAADYKTIFSDKLTIRAVHARSMEGIIVPEYTLPVAISGGLNGEQMPLDTTLPVEFDTGLTGGGNHGAFYPFTPDEAQNTATGFPGSSYITLVANALGALRVALALGSAPLVVASFQYGTFVEVVGEVVRGRWGTQRRRLTQYE